MSVCERGGIPLISFVHFYLFVVTGGAKTFSRITLGRMKLVLHFVSCHSAVCHFAVLFLESHSAVILTSVTLLRVILLSFC
jgi:hypothetical protein